MKFADIQKMIEKESNSKKLKKEAERQLQQKLKDPKVEQEITAHQTEKRKQDAIEVMRKDIMANLVHKKVVIDVQREIGGRMLNSRKSKSPNLLDVIIEYHKDTGFNISESCLSRWESGQRSVDIIFLLWFAEKYNANLRQLLTGEEPEPKDKIAQDAVQDLERVSADIAELIRKLKS